ERLALMVNCDALARFGHTSLRVTKRPEILGYFRRLVAELDLPVPVDSTGWLPGSSDEWPFLVEGVPAVSARGTQTPEERSRGRGLDHTQADTVDKIDDWRAREAAVALARILVAVADDEERPGPKLARAAVFEQLRRDGAEEELRVQGRWHPESIL
ncbi:MAG TPA: M28 family peptidase, partial [Nitrolancea sp.]|nr:M28 family peptidase [Nitrolancea sp.]